MRGARQIVAWLFTAAFCSLTVCAQSSPFAREEPSRVEAREAIFRYMFAHYKYDSRVRVFCLETDKPQPESFLRRFTGSSTRVVWASHCESSGAMNEIIEKKTHARAMRMTIQSITWISGNEAEAEVEAFSDGIAANWNTLRLNRRSGSWVVVGDKINGVS